MDNEHRLIGELAAALGAASSDGQRVTRAASMLRARLPRVRMLLDAVASDPAIAAAVARSSYWHANGFAKLVLHRNADPAFQLRLHIWAPDDAEAPPAVGYNNIHSHRWEFASVVLCGTLHSKVYAETQPDNPKALVCNKFEYDSSRTDTTGQLRSVGLRALATTGEFDYGPGDMHVCDTRLLHSVTPHDTALTATLLVQGPSRERSALVYQEVGREALEDTGAGIDQTAVAQLASATLAAMNGAGR